MLGATLDSGVVIGVLFGCFARHTHGDSFSTCWFFIIYQGHLFPLKGHLCLCSFHLIKSMFCFPLLVFKGICVTTGRFFREGSIGWPSTWKLLIGSAGWCWTLRRPTPRRASHASACSEELLGGPHPWWLPAIRFFSLLAFLVFSGSFHLEFNPPKVILERLGDPMWMNLRRK